MPFQAGTAFQISVSSRGRPACARKARSAAEVGEGVSRDKKPVRAAWGPGFSISRRTRAPVPPSSGPLSGTSPGISSRGAVA